MAGGPFMLPGSGVDKGVTAEDWTGAGSLTLGAVACPEQGFLILTVICEGEGQ